VSELDALLARSRAPGEFVERRSFTLSREKAIEKLREFTLPHSAQYVLELVQAAVFADATWIAVDVRPSTVTFAWCGGETLVQRDLEELFDHLFIARSDDRKRHVVQVAIAVNALLQERPKLLRIESGDGTWEGSVRMDLDADGDGVLGTPQGGMAGTYIHVRRRGALLRMLDGPPTAAEVQFIEERCVHCPVPILLNGSAPFGYHPQRAVPLHGRRHVRRFDADGRYGALGWTRGLSGVRVVIGGVWVTTRDLEVLWRGAEPVSGVVCDDSLRKTADQSDVVEDDRWYDMLRALAPVAAASVRERIERRGDRPGSWKQARIVDPRDARDELVPAPEPEGEPEPPPPLGGDTEETKPVSRPQERKRPAVEEKLLQAAGRGRISHEGLRSLPPGRPVFTVPVGDPLLRSDAIAPDVFPHPVLIVATEAEPALREAFPDIRFSPLTNEQEVRFVGASLTEADEIVEVMEAWGGPGKLTLRAHLRGHPPAWGDPMDGDVPLLVEAGVGAVRALRTARLGLGVPGLSVHLEHVSRARLGILSHLSLLEDPIRAALPRLALACVPRAHDPDPDLARAARDVIGAALAVHARPWFVRDGDSVSARAALPPGSRAEQLLTTPLLPSGENFVGFTDWTRTLGTEDVLQLDGATVPEWLETLEARFGFGHLTTPVLRSRAVLALALIGDTWSPFTARRGSIPMLATGLMVVCGTLDPNAKTWNAAYPGPRPWKTIHLGVPGLLVLRRGEVSGDPWSRGADAMYLAIAAALRSRAAPPDGVGVARARGMLRRVGLELAVRRRDAPWKEILAASTPVSVHDAIADDTFRVAPAGKLGAASDVVLGMTLDEVRLLQSRGHRVDLLFDDAPEVWESLVAGEDSQWIARTDIDGGGMKARIGLRRPFDDTAGVIAWSHAVPHALPDPIEGLPVHGVVQLEGARTEPMTHQWARLKSGVLRLYDAVLETAGRGRLGPDDAADYARYTELLLAARRRAQQEPVKPAPARPKPSAAPAKAKLSPAAALERELRNRLGTGVARDGLTTVLVTSGDEAPVGPGPVARSIGLQRGHPLVRAALGGDRRAVDLLALEAARVALAGSDAASMSEELLALHRRLLAR